MGMGAYCTYKPMKGNKMGSWRILEVKCKLTNVQLGVI
jgi:hypothetical protein